MYSKDRLTNKITYLYNRYKNSMWKSAGDETMKNIIYEDFQTTISELLTRHKSILDLMTKLSDSNARVNRAIAKSVTNCGCISVNAKKQKYPEDETLEGIAEFLDDHLDGNLCDSCRDIIEKELGNHLFYLASMANTLDISLYDIILKEEKSLSALGKFHLK